MLHILVILLKIIGVLLLVILGLALLVLLVPVRYSFAVEKEEGGAPKGVVRVTWFLALLYVKASYIDKILDYRVRIAGYQLLGNQEEFLQKKEKKKKKREEKERKKQEREARKEEKAAGAGKSASAPETKSLAPKTPEETAAVPETMAPDPGDAEAAVESKASESGTPTGTIPAPETITPKEAEAAAEAESPVEAGSSPESKAPEGTASAAREPEPLASGASATGEGKASTKKDTAKTPPPSSQEKKTGEEEEKKEALPTRLRRIAAGIRGKLQSLGETVSNVRRLYEEYQGAALLRIAKETVIRVLRHVLPRRLNGWMVFGFDDPAATGMACGAAAVFYPKYADHFSLEPDFTRSCFAAKCCGRGRIRLGFFLVLLVWLLLKQEIRKLIRAFSGRG